MSPHVTENPEPVRVLVVDDYAPMADQLAKALRHAGHEAIAAYSGEDALRVAEQLKPQALIADVMMPEMNGAELVCAFAERFPSCRAVLMTANQWLPEIFISGVRVKVFQKPFDLEEVFKFVATCVS